MGAKRQQGQNTIYELGLEKRTVGKQKREKESQGQ